ncbi:MAG: hypothetical protein F6K41_09440 [Symploca sp. SIO3E6]|nr:hypothetical protein [Caldora sp. SIO3E6]
MGFSYNIPTKLWLIDFSLTLALLTSGLTTSPAQAETVLAQIIPNNSPKPSLRNNLQPGDLPREEPSLPENFEEPPSLPNNLLDFPDLIRPNQLIPGNLVVERFEFKGNTVFSSARLAEAVQNSQVFDQEASLLDIANQSISFEQLYQIAHEVTKFYHEQGYKTTGATPLIPKDFQLEQSVVIVIDVIEGHLETIAVTEMGAEEDESPSLRQQSMRNYVIQLIPFIDMGAGWNNSNKPDTDPNLLAAVGLGVQWQQGNSFTARLDWGVPLVSVDSRNRTWQENGLHFSVRWDF